MNTQLTVIESAKKTTQPPLTKQQVIEATALALFNKDEATRKKLWVQRELILKKRNAFFRSHALKSKKLIQFNGTENWRGHWIMLKVPYDPSIGNDFEKQLEALKMPSSRSVKDYIKEIREASQATKPELQTLLNDPAINQKFVTLGESILGKQAN